ncbi:MAG: hypothetical protein DRN30_03795 [Thermoplasmata archaeon]|nr:site-2 protease family protein [Euryarchaeota archaeon]RLF65536.1 MAG: hypothetical protein DRN30_03795 [Thermoplasmata archaeon]
MNTLILALFLVSAWVFFTIYLSTRYQGEYKVRSLRIHFYVPFILVGSTRISKFINRLSRFMTRSVKIFFVVVAIITMLLIMYVLGKSSFLYVKNLLISEEKPPVLSPRLAVALPGLNPIIPISYGIVALIIAVVVHEISHGIVARSEKLEIEDTGVLFFLIPLGAYVNVKEEQLKEASPRTRIKVFSSGPAINVVFALVLLAGLAGMGHFIEAKEGILLLGGIEGTDAYGKVLKGDVLIAIENYSVRYPSDIGAILEDLGKRPGDLVNLTVIRKNEEVKISIVLSDKYNFTGNSSDIGKPFIGIFLVPIDGKALEYCLSAPYRDLFLYLSLPFMRLAPISEPISLMFNVPAPGIFWPVYNTLYWLFWMNIVLGTANVLPAFPFDGYGILQSMLDAAGERLKSMKRLSKPFLIAISIITYILILLPYVGPFVFG